LIHRLKTEFIPVSGNTHDLQWRKSPAQRFFMTISDGTIDPGLKKVRDCSQDPQGFYIAGADGTSYGWNNDHDPDNVEKYMDRGLAAFRAHPPKATVVSDDERRAAFAVTPDPSTSVVRVFSRIRPLPDEVWGLNRSVGRDFLWIYADEVRAIAKAAKTGAPFALPDSLVRRIVRFHLVDNVRGTPDMWGPHEVQRAQFVAARVDGGGGLRVKFSGDFAMHNKSRGHVGAIDGELELDEAAARVTRFRAYSRGQAWGAGSQTPFPPPGRFTLHIAMVEGTDEIARIVPPEAVSTRLGDERYRDPK
jgi:hypothetical protein